MFLFSKTSKPVLGPLNLLFSGYWRAVFQGFKWPGQEADLSHPPRTMVKNMWNYTSSALWCRQGHLSLLLRCICCVYKCNTLVCQSTQTLFHTTKWCINYVGHMFQ